MPLGCLYVSCRGFVISPDSIANNKVINDSFMLIQTSCI